MSYIRSLLLFACCAPPLVMAQVLQPALLQQDFQILRSALQEGHPGIYGNTSGPGALLLLPNSNLRLPIRLMTYYMAIEGTKYGNHSIPPDHAVSYSIEEMLAGKDKEMETALQLIARPYDKSKKR